jgi:hypothetical protein
VVFLSIGRSRQESLPELPVLDAAVVNTPIPRIERVDALRSIKAFHLDPRIAGSLRGIPVPLLLVFVIDVRRTPRLARLSFLGFLTCGVVIAIAMVKS